MWSGNMNNIDLVCVPLRRPNAFAVITAGRVFTFVAESPSTMHKWIGGQYMYMYTGTHIYMYIKFIHVHVYIICSVVCLSFTMY